MAAPRASTIFFSLLAAALPACSGPPNPEGPRVTGSAPSVSASATAAPAAPAARKSDRFAVAAENETAVEVARLVLDKGGSAADAAIAGVLVACAAHPASCGLGGGGAALYWDASKKEAVALDFRETAPSGIKRSDYLTKNPAKGRRGLMVGVPGLAAGLGELHRRGGKLPWASVVTQAADRIEAGIPLSPYMAQAFAWSSKWLGEDARARALGPIDAESRVGEKLANPPLVSALRTLAKGGAQAFYTGPLADELVDTARAAGSRMIAADLKSYEVGVRPPLRSTWGELEVATMPPSSAGGISVLQLLGMFDSADLAALEAASGSYVHALAEGLRAANQDRVLFVGDPDFTRTDTTLFDGEKMRSRRSKIKMDSSNLPKISSISESGTLSLVVVDESGNAVSISASISSMFGAKIVSKNGYLLNDTLTEFNIDDYGMRVVNKGPNFARGRARPVSSLTPLFVLSKGEPVLAVAASGGLRAPSAV
ncbi:MAG: gamma-glutamyltransferase, partial [Myxococcales bacterium]|nr:gamma-glutamyltransferase [Myxococcales bacterium]